MFWKRDLEFKTWNKTEYFDKATNYEPGFVTGHNTTQTITSCDSKQQ